jgi:hypothetical protein
MELVSLEALEVATTPSPPPSQPCQSSAIVDSGALDASVTTANVVSLSDEIDKTGVLAPNPVSSVILPMELVSSEALEVATTPSPPPSGPCQSSAIVDSGALDASVTTANVVSLSDEIDKAGVLAPNSEALFGKEICNLLVSLEAASPGYGKELPCVLSGKASKELIKKMEKSLSIIKIRKRRVTRKASSAA